MQVRSFVTDHGELVPITVELTLWPGLPNIQFVGLPNQHLKESAHRIRSAIKAQGFKFPRAQQILVNLRPSHLRKNSLGVELAVAAAYLWRSGQVPPPEDENPVVYGELTLDGHVLAPGDLFCIQSEQAVLTGQSDRPLAFDQMCIQRLADLRSPTFLPASEELKWQRPEQFSHLGFSEEEGSLLSVLASGEHSCLLAGPAGSGKSTLARVVHALLPEPDYKPNSLASWRPLVDPHHSTPRASMLGGSTEIHMGEIAKAHRGVLVLDELLEFDLRVIEGLREPMETGSMRVSRAGKSKEWPVRAQILATTNLCPCGDFLPNEYRTPCRYSLQRCRSYSQRLSGPLLDRFQTLVFARRRRKEKLVFEDVLARVLKAVEFRKEQRGQALPNAWVDVPMTSKLEFLLPDGLGSQRRRISTLRVARSFADLEASTEIEGRHINLATALTHSNFELIKHWE